MDGRKSRHIGEVLEGYRGEDAGDLKRIELNELVVNMTYLNAFEGKFWKSDPQIVTDEKINPKIVTGEKSWKNLGKKSEVRDEWRIGSGTTWMNAKFVKNFVMYAKTDPKVVVDLSFFQNWWMEQFATQ